MIRRLLAALRATATATSEGQSERNGILSWAGEGHALEYGLGLGAATSLAFLLVGPAAASTTAAVAVGVILEALRRDAPTDDLPIPRAMLRQIRRELHYYLVGLVVGLSPALVVAGPTALFRALVG